MSNQSRNASLASVAAMLALSFSALAAENPTGSPGIAVRRNGAFALFAPEQQTTLQADIVAPEGRIYFAGEHCSLYHAWIQGALESGIRAARQIHETADARELVADR